MAKSKSKKVSKKTSKKPAEEQVKEVSKKTSHKPKKEVLLKGIAMHLLTYVIICAVLIMMGVPLYIALIVFIVLVWGMFVLSYALWYEK